MGGEDCANWWIVCQKHWNPWSMCWVTTKYIFELRNTFSHIGTFVRNYPIRLNNTMSNCLSDRCEHGLLASSIDMVEQYKRFKATIISITYSSAAPATCSTPFVVSYFILAHFSWPNSAEAIRLEKPLFSTGTSQYDDVSDDRNERALIFNICANISGYFPSQRATFCSIHSRSDTFPDDSQD